MRDDLRDAMLTERKPVGRRSLVQGDAQGGAGQHDVGLFDLVAQQDTEEAELAEHAAQLPSASDS